MRAFLPRLTLAAILALATVPSAALAQTAAKPALPPPQGGSFTSSGSYQITSSSNEHGSALWVVDAVQHTVTLCEKVDTAKDFSCTKKPLP
jgi:hypothetical protein